MNWFIAIGLMLIMWSLISIPTTLIKWATKRNVETNLGGHIILATVGSFLIGAGV